MPISLPVNNSNKLNENKGIVNGTIRVPDKKPMSDFRKIQNNVRNNDEALTLEFDKNIDCIQKLLSKYEAKNCLSTKKEVISNPATSIKINFAAFDFPECQSKLSGEPWKYVPRRLKKNYQDNDKRTIVKDSKKYNKPQIVNNFEKGKDVSGNLKSNRLESEETIKKKVIQKQDAEFLKSEYQEDQRNFDYLKKEEGEHHITSGPTNYMKNIENGEVSHSKVNEYENMNLENSSKDNQNLTRDADGNLLQNIDPNFEFNKYPGSTELSRGMVDNEYATSDYNGTKVGNRPYSEFNPYNNDEAKDSDGASNQRFNEKIINNVPNAGFKQFKTGIEDTERIVAEETASFFESKHYQRTSDKYELEKKNKIRQTQDFIEVDDKFVYDIFETVPLNRFEEENYHQTASENMEVRKKNEIRKTQDFIEGDDKFVYDIFETVPLNRFEEENYHQMPSENMEVRKKNKIRQTQDFIEVDDKFVYDIFETVPLNRFEEKNYHQIASENVELKKKNKIRQTQDFIEGDEKFVYDIFETVPMTNVKIYEEYAGNMKTIQTHKNVYEDLDNITEDNPDDDPFIFIYNSSPDYDKIGQTHKPVDGTFNEQIYKVSNTQDVLTATNPGIKSFPKHVPNSVNKNTNPNLNPTVRKIQRMDFKAADPFSCIDLKNRGRSNKPIRFELPADFCQANKSKSDSADFIK